MVARYFAYSFCLVEVLWFIGLHSPLISAFQWIIWSFRTVCVCVYIELLSDALVPWPVASWIDIRFFVSSLQVIIFECSAAKNWQRISCKKSLETHKCRRFLAAKQPNMIGWYSGSAITQLLFYFCIWQLLNLSLSYIFGICNVGEIMLSVEWSSCHRM